ncbi:hypothetical protein LTR05_003565 [Lithohypha guttulata]|uniref:Heterokaryon incompatibility domain-containing protein n=1 Tax=Lithohypha guttulata TaxID=1690604 RepID=A0AAN7T1R3_9EURO|nr:hypothetical protein LTR05_003565 [Lithohypha guttulata]
MQLPIGESSLMSLAPTRNILKLEWINMDGGGYLALSYAWGSPIPDPERHMFIGGIDSIQGCVPLTYNLDNALRDLQDSEIVPKVFFIDQISINQNDNQEKSVQVAGMGNVYKYADKVITYLGPGEGGDQLAIDLLNRITEHIGPWMNILKSVGGLTMDVIDQITRRDMAFTTLFEVAESEIESFRHLERVVYQNGWAQRLWMCQENLLNKNIMFLKGSTLIERQFIFMFPLIQALGLVFPLPGESGDSFNQAISMAVFYQEPHDKQLARSFFSLVNTFGATLCCTDPKDGIYGLLGLARDSWSISPDYDADNLNVYADFAQKSIEKTQTLRILNYANLETLEAVQPPVPTNYPSWPSWVLTFQASLPDAYTNLAAGSTVTQTHVKVSDMILNATGFEVARIDVVIGVFDQYASPLTMVTPYDSLCNTTTLIEAAQKILNSREIANAEQRLCQTLTQSFRSPVADQSDRDWNSCAAYAFNVVLDVMRRARDNRDPEFPFAPVSTTHLLEDEAKLADCLIPALELKGQSLCITTCGMPLMAPANVQKDDIVTVLLGGGEAYILRPGDEDLHSMVGRAFAYGYMNGETLIDDLWEDRLAHVIVKILNLEYYPLELATTGENTIAEEDLRKDLQSTMAYLIGVMYVPRSTYVFGHGIEEGTAETHAGARTFLAATPTSRKEIIRRAVQEGPFDVHVNTFWRTNWWHAIDILINNKIIPPPPWHARQRTFSIH